MGTRSPAQGATDEAERSGYDAAHEGVPRRPSWGARWAWGSWAGLGCLLVAGIFVYAGFDALPFQDLPAHAGLIALRHRYATSAFDQRFYVLSPHLGPYSLFRALGDALGSLLGPTRAVRVLGALPGLALPAALWFARARLHQDRSPAAAYLGVALSFGLMTLFGFASYLLGIAILVVTVTLWLDVLSRDVGDRVGSTELALGVAAVALFVAHGFAFVLLLVVATVGCLSGRRLTRRLTSMRALGPAVAIAAWAAWVERSAPSSPAAGRTPGALHFQGALDKASLLLTPTLTTRTGIDVVACLALWAILAMTTAAAVRASRDPATPEDRDARARSHSRVLYASALFLGVAFFALPHEIGWFGFVDGRLVPVVLILAAMAYRRDALSALIRSCLDVGLPIIASALTALVLFASWRFQVEALGYRDVLSAVPEGSRLLNLPLDPDSRIFTAHPFVHYDKLVMVARPVVVSDLWFHQGSAVYPTDKNPALRLPASYRESDLREIDWPSYELEDWDYALIRTQPDAPAPSVPPALSLVAHRGGWWLWRTSNVVP